MSLAEQKVELMQLVVSADEETTGKLIELAKQLTKTESRFTQEELSKFHATRQKYLGPEKTEPFFWKMPMPTSET